MGSKARLAGKLNALKVVHLSAPRHHGDGGGLYLQISKTGTKSWCFRFRFGSRRREMGLGQFPTISLMEARLKALDCRRLVFNGIDPIDDRLASRTKAKIAAARTVTFRECAQRYIATNKSAWRNEKHSKQWASTLETYAYPVLGSLAVQDIDQGLVLQVLEPIWNSKAETASRLRGRIETVLGWATTRGYRDGLNPARWKGHLSNVLPSKARASRVKHHKALSHKEIAAFMIDLRRQEGVAALALEFTILTAARTGEVLGAQWDEIDFDRREWKVPAGRMKAGKEHRVPLATASVAVLEKMKESQRNAFIFPGIGADKPLSNMAMLVLLRRMDRRDVTVHGCRSTFRDWAAENNFSREVAERALAHAVGNSVEAAYYRSDLSDQRRPLMEAWARYCSSPVFADPSRNVHRLAPISAVA